MILASIRRAKAAFRRGTFLGTSSNYHRDNVPYVTSSSKLSISTLNNRPNMCSTECTKRRNGSSGGGQGLLRGLQSIPPRGHATSFISTIYYIFPSNERFAIHNRYRKMVNCRGHNSNNFKCSPLFCINSHSFTRFSPRRGSTIDRQKGTLHGLTGRLPRCLGWPGNVSVRCSGWEGDQGGDSNGRCKTIVPTQWKQCIQHTSGTN